MKKGFISTAGQKGVMVGHVFWNIYVLKRVGNKYILNTFLPNIILKPNSIILGLSVFTKGLYVYLKI